MGAPKKLGSRHKFDMPDPDMIHFIKKRVFLIFQNFLWFVTRISLRFLKQTFLSFSKNWSSSFFVSDVVVFFLTFLFYRAKTYSKAYNDSLLYCVVLLKQSLFDLLWYIRFLAGRACFNPLTANFAKWSNTLKQFVGFCRRIVWVGLTILWVWCLKGSVSMEILGKFWYSILMSLYIRCSLSSSAMKTSFWKFLFFL